MSGGFDDQLRANLPDDLLHGNYVLGKLDYRTTHPCKVVRISMLANSIKEVLRLFLQLAVLRHFSKGILFKHLFYSS